MVHLTNVAKKYGDRTLFKGANLIINPNDKIGLVGPNGAGKSTLFKMILGFEGTDTGQVSFPSSTVFGYFSQDVGEMQGRSAVDEVKAGAGRVSVLAQEIEEIEKKLNHSATHPLTEDEMAKLLDRYGEAQLEFEQRGGYDLEARAREILSGLGIQLEDQDQPVESFSGGWKMRIALAKILVLKPDVLLIDEPTNHLDLESIIWLEEWLKNFKGALVMTSHDRDFMNRIVTRVFEVANQLITEFSGNYDFYLREREIRKEQLLAAHQKQQDMLAKEEEFIARFAARASHAAQVQSRIKKLEKIERIEVPKEEKAIRFEFPIPARGGEDVVKIQDASKIWIRDQREKKVLNHVHCTIRRLNRVAVVGVNGAGKSTLLKMIIGQTDPTEGKVQLGAGITVGYFSQHSLEVLNPNETIYDTISNRIPEATIGYVRNLLGAFLFSGDDVYKKVASLSGGEKSRVVIATLLAKPANLLVLDEPTNHLDIQSREVLLQALKNYEGTVVLVSHDRHFLREISNRVFEINQGILRIYEGNYKDYTERGNLGR